MTHEISVETSILDRSSSGGWRLVGQRCQHCLETLFGRRDQTCPSCGHTALEEVELEAAGTLWAYTVLRNPPPGLRRSTFPSVPCGLGLVELSGSELRVSAPLAVPIDRLRIGLSLQLEVFELCLDDDGNAVLGYRFSEAADV